MSSTLALLKGLTYPIIATTGAGSGAFVMYFAKPTVNLEKENKKWKEDMQKLRSEIDNLKSEAKNVESEWKGRLDNENKSLNQLVNFSLNIYDAKVARYAKCLGKLFDEISSYASSFRLGSLHYDDAKRATICGQRPVPEKLAE